MSNDGAKAMMLGAIEEQTTQRILQLENEAVAESERLQQEFASKVDVAIRLQQREQEQTLEHFRQKEQSLFNSEVKHLALEAHQQLVVQTLAQTYAKLEELCTGDAYRERLIAWACEGVQVVASPVVYLQLGSKDKEYLDDDLLEQIASRAKTKLDIDLTIAKHPAGTHLGRGPIISTQDGKRICDNTLAARFAREKITLTRMASTRLF
jgi:vacuolar-type H+-ATPase subunit E/Vma4